MKLYTLFFLLFILIVGCKQPSTKILTVKGSIKNAGSNKIFLESFGINNNPIILDSGLIDKIGNFYLKTLTNGEELYAIKAENQEPIWLVNDVDEITLNADFAVYKNYKTIGSTASNSLHSFIAKYDSLITVQNNLQLSVDSLQKQKATDSSQTIVKDEKKVIKNVIKEFATNAIVNTNNAGLKYFYLFYINNTNGLESNDIFRMMESASKQFPKNNQLLGLKNSMNDVVKANPKLFLINEPAINFNYLDKDSVKISLKSYTYKYLLLQFWQTNDKASKDIMPYLTETYNQFKNKKFDILNIALDSSRTFWQKNIKQDSIAWKQVVDTLGFKSEMAKKYFITAVPHNILINPTGKIIGVDMSNEELREKLKQLCP